FGRSVSISGDTAVVGAIYEDTGGSNAGAAYIFTRNGTAWVQQAKLMASDAQTGDNFGSSVSISGDTAVVGAYYEGTGGAAYIFTRNGTSWTQQAKLTASDVELNDFFGYSVSISGDTAVVGAVNEDTGGSDAGAAYIFTRNGTSWTQQAKLMASDAQTGDMFGRSVSISGDTAVVGAIYEDTGASDAGAAYIFTRNGTSWTQQAKLMASDAEVNDYFGYSVSISGDTAVVGAANEDTGGSDAGAAYIFTRNGTAWIQQAKLMASDAEANDIFGRSVSISGDTAVVGAIYEDTGGSNAGAAYIFTRNGTSWTQKAKLMASDAEANDYFGYSVSISGDTAVVGASREDTGGSDAGAAYIFTP
ncbi:FG-GAP repeat protein, partial [Vibrio cholerae]|uniref:FG-GAP repeat protein n=1 Tax=Vibrio cholerae TaxID=666 RepID=UPI000E69F4E7